MTDTEFESSRKGIQFVLLCGGTNVRKTKMDQIDIKQLEQKLKFQRQEILHFLRQLEDETRSLDVDSTQDIADRCVIDMSKESLFERRSQQRTLLRLIEAALKRTAEGSFGTCVTCGDDIPARRLQAVPWTQFCLPCQEAIEQEVGASVSARAPVTTATWRRAG
jgi:DnaK suppressor protein